MISFYPRIYYLDHVPQWSYGINHFDYQQIPSLYILLQLCFFYWLDHDHTYNMGNGRCSRNFSTEKWLLISLPQGNIDLHLKDLCKCDRPWALIWFWKECQHIRTHTHWEQEVKIGARNSEAARNEAPVPKRAWYKSVAQWEMTTLHVLGTPC